MASGGSGYTVPMTPHAGPMRLEDDVPAATDGSRSHHGAETERPRGSLRRPPVSRRGLVVWFGAYVVMTGAAILVGFLIVDHLGGVRDLDTRVAHWLGDRRTATWNDLTWVGSGVAEAVVKITATIVLSLVFIWRWRRWSEPTLLAGALGTRGDGVHHCELRRRSRTTADLPPRLDTTDLELSVGAHRGRGRVLRGDRDHRVLAHAQRRRSRRRVRRGDPAPGDRGLRRACTVVCTI